MKKLYRFKAVAMVFCLSLVALAVLPSAKADDWNKKTTVTFNAPVEVPGVGAQILPAGTYVFKLLDSPSDRHIVQIFNQAEDHVYTTILAIPDYRMRATGKTVMTFKERGRRTAGSHPVVVLSRTRMGRRICLPQVAGFGAGEDRQ